MTELKKIIEKIGYTKQELVDCILDKILADGVKLKEFNDDQQKQIIIHYAAIVLA